MLLGALAPAVQQLCTLVAAKAAEATAQRDELLGAWQQQDKAAAAEANQRSTAAHDGMAVFSKMQAFFTKMEAGKEASYIEHLLSEVEAACIDAQLHGVTERWLAGMAQLGDRWGDVLHTVEDVQHMAIVEQVLCTLLIQMHDPCTPPGGTTQLTWEQQERQRAAAAASTVADTNASATAACSGGLDSGSGRTLKFDAVRVPADPPLVGFEGHRQRWRELVVEGTESLVHCAQGLVDIRQVQLEDSLAMLLAKLEGALQRFHQAAPGAPQEARAELVELWMRHPGLILQILQQASLQWLGRQGSHLGWLLAREGRASCGSSEGGALVALSSPPSSLVQTFEPAPPSAGCPPHAACCRACRCMCCRGCSAWRRPACCPSHCGPARPRRRCWR